MSEIEESYADERWKKARLTESEQRLLVKEFQSLIRNAPTSAYLHPKQKVLGLEYYNLWKLLEHIQTDIEQSESIEVLAEIEQEEAKRSQY